MTAISEIYPYATQDGKAIPLDILKPSYLLALPFTADASASIALPAGAQVGMLISDVAAVVSFHAALTSLSGSYTLEKALIIPEKAIVSTVLLASPLYVRGVAESGTLYIQIIEKWAGLALDKQYIRK